jgi:hypothetical protein
MLLLSITKNFNVKLKIMLTLLEIVQILDVTGIHFGIRIGIHILVYGYVGINISVE